MGMLQDTLKGVSERRSKEEKKRVFSSSDQFWEAWVNADELQRNAMVQTLSVFNMVKDPNMKRALVNLVNSYLVDLHTYMANVMRYMTSDKPAAVAEGSRYPVPTEKDGVQYGKEGRTGRDGTGEQESNSGLSQLQP